MKLEAVTVCVDYADFLCWTLLFNKPLFDRWVVVTSCKDQRTRDLCEYHHVECVTTDSFYADDKAFVKSNGINVGLDALAKDGWVLHLDADVALPPRTRTLLEAAELDPASIYGADRIMCPDFESWVRHVSGPEIQHSCDAFIQANAFPLGVRVGNLRQDGWAPIGFFQLWNPKVSGIGVYPPHGACDRSDLSFAKQWTRGKRHLLPEIVGIHLQTPIEGDGLGANWRGRRSPHFGPPPLWTRPPPTSHPPAKDNRQPRFVCNGS